MSKVKARLQLLRTLLLLSLAGLSSASLASSEELFGAELGAWLERTAVPELTEVLGRHPKFSGETIRVVTMRDGKPSSVTDGLSQALRAQLTHKLSRSGNIRIAWLDAALPCAAVTRSVPYLLGVETLRRGRRKAEVRIALVDVEEAVWVPGVNLHWSGVLTANEHQALATQHTSAPAGTLASPIELADYDRVAEQLMARINCNLRHALEGEVFILAQKSSELAGLALHLRQRIGTSPRLSIARREADADWLLEMQLSEVEGVGHELVLELRSTDQDLDQALQRLAAVYVRPAHSLMKRTAGPSVQVSAVTVPRIKQRQGPLLRSMKMVEPALSNRCRMSGDARGSSPVQGVGCVEVELALLRASYLVVFQTEASGRLALPDCAAPRNRVNGLKRFRLSPRGSSARVYAVATQDRALARRVHESLREAAVNCSRPAKPIRGVWLERTVALLDRHTGAYEWRDIQIPDLDTVPGAIVSRR